MPKRSWIVATTIIMTGVAALCAAEDRGVTLRVTHDFKRPPLIERRVTLSNQSVIGILKECAGVETSFGGGFVRAIDGVGSGSKGEKNHAWLYYVNGVVATIGALQYSPGKGDLIWWDYHAWGRSPIQALIGAYPKPFAVGGAGGATMIVYTPTLRAKATELAESIRTQGAADISLQPASGTVATEKGHIIVIGQWREITAIPAVRDLYTRKEKCGLFVGLTPDAIHVLDLDMKPRASFPRAGALLAGPLSLSPPRVLWLITGTDDESVLRAADVLIRQPERIKGTVAAVLCGEKIYTAPVIDE